MQTYFVFECNEIAGEITTEKEALELCICWQDISDVYDTFKKFQNARDTVYIDSSISCATVGWTRTNMKEEYSEYHRITKKKLPKALPVPDIKNISC